MQVNRCLDAELVSPMNGSDKIRISAGNVRFKVENVDDVPVTDGLRMTMMSFMHSHSYIYQGTYDPNGIESCSSNFLEVIAVKKRTMRVIISMCTIFLLLLLFCLLPMILQRLQCILFA